VTALERSSLLIPLRASAASCARSPLSNPVRDISMQRSGSSGQQDPGAAADCNRAGSGGCRNLVESTSAEWTVVCLQCWRLALQLLEDEDVAVRCAPYSCSVDLCALNLNQVDSTRSPTHFNGSEL
jgi:hypothetical protein